MQIDPEKKLREARKKRKNNYFWAQSMVIHIFFISFSLYVGYLAWPLIRDLFGQLWDVIK